MQAACRSGRLRSSVFRLALPAMMLLVAGRLNALEISDWCSDHAPGLEIEIKSRSGTPLTLEFVISDPEKALRTVSITTADTTAEFSAGGREELDLKLTPFRGPGVHALTLAIDTENGSCERELEVGFSEFIWGRDNFRFSNRRSPHGSVRPYSAVLFPWTEERFGALQREEQTLLLEFAYRLFGGRIGRCYAFSGSQVRYMRNPDDLPRHYDTIYAVREGAADVQEEMNMLQNDIMFDQFIAKGYGLQGEQSLEALRSEVDALIEEIAAGRPATFGYVAPERHHSLLAYGYIADTEEERITFITANNWGDEHDENAFSEAAERIAVNLREDYDDDRVRWVDPPVRAYRHAEHLFKVEVREEFEHDSEKLFGMINERRAQLQEGERVLVVVEQAGDAVLIDEEETKSGRVGRRRHTDLEMVEYTRLEDVHLFEFPAEYELVLRVTTLDDDRDETSGTNVYVLSHPDANALERSHSMVYTDLDESERKQLELRISPAGLELLVDPDEPEPKEDESE